jgi:hypothetical protein
MRFSPVVSTTAAALVLAAGTASPALAKQSHASAARRARAAQKHDKLISRGGTAIEKIRLERVDRRRHHDPSTTSSAGAGTGSSPISTGTTSSSHVTSSPTSGTPSSSTPSPVSGAPTPVSGASVADFFNSDDADNTTGTESAEYYSKVVQIQYNGPSTKALVDQIHADDPGVKVFMYADPTIVGGFTPGSPSNGCVGSDSGGAAWMLYDGALQISGKTNLGDASFDSACISNVMNQAKSADFDGIFWDEINAVPGYAVPSSCINGYQAAACSLYGSGASGYSQWDNNVETFVQAVGAADNANNMESVLNVGGANSAPGAASTSVWDQWVGTSGITGAMEESFVGADEMNSSVGYTQWQGELANEAWSEANGKMFLGIHYDINQTEQSQDVYGLASMLMAANGYSSYSSETTPAASSGTYTFWPEYTEARNLGAPQGAYTTTTSNGATVYERRFANGLVIVNPTTNSTGSVSLGGTYSGTGNEPTNISSLALGPQTGYVLTTS